MTLNRVMLPSTHFEVQGFCMYADPEEVHAENTLPVFVTNYLSTLKRTNARRLAGNSFHVSSIGSVLVFLLAVSSTD
jgi:hypothetical protein